MFYFCSRVCFYLAMMLEKLIVHESSDSWRNGKTSREVFMCDLVQFIIRIGPVKTVLLIHKGYLWEQVKEENWWATTCG